jgi:hypothetical protein
MRLIPAMSALAMTQSWAPKVLEIMMSLDPNLVWALVLVLSVNCFWTPKFLNQFETNIVHLIWIKSSPRELNALQTNENLLVNSKNRTSYLWFSRRLYYQYNYAEPPRNCFIRLFKIQ